jgi:uncharacterized protein (DUF4415 family)
MSPSPDEESKNKQGSQEEPTQIDFGDVSDLRAIVSETPKAQTAERGKAATGEVSNAVEKERKVQTAERGKPETRAEAKAAGETAPVLGDFEDPIAAKKTFSAGLGSVLKEHSDAEGWPAGKAGAAGNPAAKTGTRSRGKAEEARAQANADDRVPEVGVRDERLVGVDPGDDYEVVEDQEELETKSEEWFWDQAAKVFPGCLGNKISVPVDPDIWEWFKSKGPNWEDRVNELLREHMEKNS